MTAIALGKAHLAADQFFQAADLGMVAVEQAEETGLRAGGALAALGLELAQAVLDFRQVQHQVVGPQAGPLADGGRLRRLEMGVGQAGQIAILRAKSARRSITPTTRSRTSSSDSRSRSRSVLSVT